MNCQHAEVLRADEFEAVLRERREEVTLREGRSAPERN